LIALAHHTAEAFPLAGAVQAQDRIQAVENAPQPDHLVVAWSGWVETVHHSTEDASEVRLTRAVFMWIYSWSRRGRSVLVPSEAPMRADEKGWT
jgi:hypothetical protein